MAIEARPRLRPAQQAAVQNVLEARRRRQKFALVHMVPGSGKSAVVAEVMQALVARDSVSILVLADNGSSLDSARLAFDASYPDIPADLVRFSTVRRIANGPASSETTLSEPPPPMADVVISLDFSFAGDWAKSPHIQHYLDRAQFVCTVTSITRREDVELYGEPVFTLPVQEAIAGGYLVPLVFHAMASHCASPPVGQEQAQRVVDDVLAAVRDDRFVFVCADVQTVHLFAEMLRRKIGPGATVVTHTSERRASNDDIAQGQFFVVTSAMYPTLPAEDLRHMVLCRRMANADQFLAAVTGVMRVGANRDVAHVWDFGGNRRLAEAQQFMIEDARIDTAAAAVDDEKVEAVVSSQRWVRTVSDGIATRDLMRRERLVHVLRGVINAKADSRSLAIGLFGRWGSGKSTLIELLKNRFGADRKVSFIQFNAWDNEHATSMAAALADSITQQVYASEGVWRRTWLLVRHRLIIKRDLLPLLTLLVLALTLGSFLIPVPKADPAQTFLSGVVSNEIFRIYATLAMSVALTAQLIWKHPLTEGIRSFVTKVSYAEHIGLTRRLKDELRSLFDAAAFRLRDRLLGKPPGGKNKYVVVIDDLDRCSRQSVWNVIEATRMVAEFHEVVLIFAVDYRLLFDAIAARLSDKADSAGAVQASMSREFLGKILQLSIQLPDPTPATVASFISTGLFQIDGSASLSALVKRDAAPGLPPTVVSPDSESPSDTAPAEPEVHYEMSDSYLDSTPDEATVFTECAAVFLISNPRTLLRVYNSMVLTKGLYPEIDGNAEYARQLFFIFLAEFNAINTGARIDQTMLDGEGDPVPAEPLRKNIMALANQLGIAGAAHTKRNALALERAAATSLPLIH